MVSRVKRESITVLPLQNELLHPWTSRKIDCPPFGGVWGRPKGIWFQSNDPN